MITDTLFYARSRFLSLDPLFELILASQLQSLYIYSQAGVPKCLGWLIQTLSQPSPLALTSLFIDILHTTLFCDDKFEATTKLWNDLAAGISAVLDSSGVNVRDIAVRIKGVSRFARIGVQAQDTMTILNGHGRGLEVELNYYKGDVVYSGESYRQRRNVGLTLNFRIISGFALHCAAVSCADGLGSYLGRLKYVLVLHFRRNFNLWLV